MSFILPDGATTGEEVQVLWDVREDGVTITVSLDECSIVVEASQESVPVIPFLTRALPEILDRAFVEIEKQEDEEES